MTAKKPRGSRAYDDADVRAGYLAHRHSDTASPNVVMEEPAFVAAVGSLKGCQVLDLGCGDGSTSSLVMSLGASEYVGIDGSAGMIATARDRYSRPGASFMCHDIEDLALEPSTFDVIASRMAFHYIDDLEPVLAQVARALRPGGRFVFSVSHPVITSHDTSDTVERTNWIVDDYFVRGGRERAWFGATVVWYHRTIADYVRLVTEAGLRLERLDECEPSARLLSANPGELRRRRRVPLILLIAASKS